LSNTTFIDPETLAAYRETEYCVMGDQPFVLRVGQHCPQLLSAHRQYGASSSAFITACNPLSQALSEADNAERQDRLAAELRARDLVFHLGIGQHPSNCWPGEPSYLIFGLSLEAAKALGNKFDQNAIVWAGEDGMPQLILLR
jgi:hypothetical protein